MGRGILEDHAPSQPPPKEEVEKQDVTTGGYVETPAKVSSTCLVTVARNRYSVPCEWAAQMVSTRLYPAQIVVVAGDAVVATHERLSDRNQTRYDWQHYVPLIERKPGALRDRKSVV